VSLLCLLEPHIDIMILSKNSTWKNGTGNNDSVKMALVIMTQVIMAKLEK